MKLILLLFAFTTFTYSATSVDLDTVPVVNTKNSWQGIPSIEKTKEGRVFVSWYSGGKEEPMPENEVYLSYSDTNGKTFTNIEVLAGPKNGTRAFDPCLWIDPDGRLWYFFNRGSKNFAVHEVYARICERPNAQKLIWSDEFKINLNTPYVFRMNKITVLSTGAWILPVTHANTPIYDWFAGTKQLQGVAISLDKGKNWKLYGAIEAPAWALECMIIEKKDGRLWMLMRTGSGFLWESYSSDKGKTWSEGKASAIASPGSRFFIRRLQSGNLLLLNHYNFKGRSHLTAQISIDDGSSWNEGLLLDERTKVSYPDAVQDSDGLIWMVYDRDRYGAGDILLAKFNEEDIQSGTNSSGFVTLKQRVSYLNKKE